MRRPDIPVLTSLRFPAAFAIFLYHACPMVDLPRGLWGGLNEGVSFFYVLSGFILFYNYFDLPDRGDFWAARLARIWPVHLATLALALLVLPWPALWGSAWWPLVLPVNIFLLQAWAPFHYVTLSFNAVAWSLSVEAFFYFSFPWLCVWLKRWGPAPLLFGSFSLGAGLVILAQAVSPRAAEVVAVFNPLCRGFEFILGMATCHFWLRERTRPVGTTFGELAASLLVLATLWLIARYGLTSGMALPGWLATVVCAVEFAVVIWLFAHQTGWLSRAFSGRAFVLLGQISFSMYMCHQIVLRRFVTGLARTPEEKMAIFASCLAGTLVLSWLLFQLVETPMRHRIVGAYRAARTKARSARR